MKKLFFAALSALALFVSCTEDFAGSTPEGNETPAVDKPAANEIWYTAAEKVTPYNSDAFGATILSNEWDSETGEGIITFDGAVTSIGNEAFKNCSSLTSINIPKGVNSIKYHAFAGCSNLTKIFCKPTTPPSIYYQSNPKKGSFPFNSEMIIYVPTGSYDDYIQYSTSNNSMGYIEQANWYQYESYIQPYDFN